MQSSTIEAAPEAAPDGNLIATTTKEHYARQRTKNRANQKGEEVFHCLQVAILAIAGAIASGATDTLTEHLQRVRSFIEKDAEQNPGWDDGGFHQIAFELVDDLLAQARNAAKENVGKISTE